VDAALHERRGDRSENANDKQDCDQLDQCGSFGETRLPLFDLLQFFFATGRSAPLLGESTENSEEVFYSFSL
jgi:hypothetical protein